MALPTGPIRSLKQTMPNFTAGTARLKFSAVIYLQIEDDPERIGIKLLSPATLGRAGGDDDSIDLDLNPYEAATKGVSRRHAVLERARDTVMLIDQDSTNGTYLNGQRLKPFERRVVRDGDEIRLANLSLRVYF
jgi:pSer/pThr/pTyr-binding forkhead associated (FHA) protein